jgi:hypothetical protein
MQDVSLVLHMALLRSAGDQLSWSYKHAAPTEQSKCVNEVDVFSGTRIDLRQLNPPIIETTSASEVSYEWQS